jgi:putative lipoprotein
MVCSAALGCASGPDGASGSADSLAVSGEVFYLARIALPPDAVLTVRLEDVSRADAPARLVTEVQSELKGRQVPIPFALRYPKSALDDRGVYHVRAAIRSGDRLLFTSTEAIPVDARNGAEGVQIRLNLPNPTVSEEATIHGSPATLAGTYWKLVELEGKPVVAVDNVREAHLKFMEQEKRIAGVGGVNQLMGTYSLEGEKLTIQPGGMTMMAGPEALMEQEQRFTKMLKNVTGYRIDGQTMELLGGDVVLARFESRVMK